LRDALGVEVDMASAKARTGKIDAYWVTGGQSKFSQIYRKTDLDWKQISDIQKHTRYCRYDEVQQAMRRKAAIEVL
jgi:hypothetical protein